MARMDSSIILGLETADIPGAIARGSEQRANMLANRNKEEYDAAVKQYGAAAIAGDKKARNFLAQWDPAGMRALDDTDAQRAADAANTAADNARADEELRIKKEKAIFDQRSAMTEAERTAAETTLKGLSITALSGNHFASEEAFDAFIVQNGGDPKMIDREDAILLMPPELQAEAINQMKGITGEIDPLTGKPIRTTPGISTPAVSPPADITTSPLSSNPDVVTGTETPTMGGAPASTEPPVGTPWPSAQFIYDNQGKRVNAGANMVFVQDPDSGQILEIPNPESVKAKEEFRNLEAKTLGSMAQIEKIDSVLNANDDDLASVLGWFEGSLYPDVLRTAERQTLADQLDSILANTFLMAGDQVKGTLTENDAAKAEAAIAVVGRSSDPDAVREALLSLRSIIAGSAATAADDLNRTLKITTGESNRYVIPEYTSKLPKAPESPATSTATDYRNLSDEELDAEIARRQKQ